jgi:phage major head subunit gpT-like protein
MSKQSKRRQFAKMILAADAGRMLEFAAETIDWIKGEGDAAGQTKIPQFKMRAYTGGPMVVGWYSSPVVVDLSGMKAAAPSIPILMNHDMTQIVGHADAIDIGDATIDISGVVSGTGAASLEVVGNAKNGFPWKASIGARPDKMEFVGEGVSTKVNGKTFTGQLFVARKSTLGEVSFVALGADSKTTVKVAASASTPNQSGERKMNEFEKWVEALGLSLADLRDDQKAQLQARYDADLKAAAAKPQNVEGAAPAVTPPAFDIQAIALVFERQMTAVQAKAAEFTGRIAADKLAEIQAKAHKEALALKSNALDEKWADARLEAEMVKAAAHFEVDLIRAERPAAPAIHGSTRDQGPQVIEAAFARTAGLQNLETHYQPAVLEASDRIRGLSIGELLIQAAAQNGYSGRQRITDGNLREVLRAAFSTHTLTTLLTSLGHKLLLDGFNAIPQTWREVAATQAVNDFKTMTLYRMTSDLEYEEVGPGGEIPHGTVGQESYDIQAKTYGKMLAITRQDIINDDLGAFGALRTKFAIGQAVKMSKVIWAAWLTARNAGTFWTAARGNLVTTAPLGEAGLDKAEKAFLDMTGPDGQHMALSPDRIIVPTALGATARKWFISQEMRDTTASTKTATGNIYQNRFTPVVVPELGLSSFTGYSATTWHMACNPAILASILVGLLYGNEAPTIESAEADFSTLGIQFRAYHDFGCSMSEWRASVEATA